MKRVGVLDLQGGVEEHIQILDKIEGVKAAKVKYLTDLEKIDGIIIPGGESTTLGRLLNIFDILEPLKEKIKQGLPVWGTCAGMILLAKHIESSEKRYLDAMDITVRRNAYGRQLGSFETSKVIHRIGEKPIPLVFIRAPYVCKVDNGVDIILELDGKIVACQQRNMLATAFHPELTSDKTFHQYFVDHLIS